MKINLQQMTVEKNEVLESFVAGMNIYSLEQRSDKLFLVRENRKTLSMHTAFTEAEDKFGKLKATKKGGEKMTDGEKKFKEAGEKLKAEKAAAEEQEQVTMTEVKNQLAQISANPDLATMYGESASLGSENLSSAAPYLKVHAAGKSTTNFLVDGKKPNDGWFFYAPTQEQFETLDVHILTISQGFRTESPPDKKTGETRMVFNQIVGGIIIDGYKPFLMFLSGKKLSPMWEFGKEAAKYTKGKPFGIPMFALTIRLTTTESPNTEGGYSWLVNFEIAKNADGTPVLVTDAGRFMFLKDGVGNTTETINGLIAKKVNPQNGEVFQPSPSLPIPEEGNAHIGAQDIPFD